MNAASEVFTLFAVVLVGYFVTRIGYFDDRTIRGVTQLVVNIALPALTNAKKQRDFSMDILTGFLIVLAASAVLMLLLVAAGLFLFRKRDSARRTVMTHLLTFSNCGFMGYPLLIAINPDWLIYGVAYNISFNILCWTVGAALYRGRENMSFKMALISPVVISSVLGFLLFVLRIRIPALPLSVLELVGGLTTPLSMLLIGTRVVGLRLRDFKDPDYHLAAFLRLVAAPLLSLGLMRLCRLPELPVVVTYILMAMPAASTVSMQAELYDGDRRFSASGVAYTTLWALVSIPLMLMLVV